MHILQIPIFSPCIPALCLLASCKVGYCGASATAPVSNRMCKVGLAPALNPAEGSSVNSSYRHSLLHPLDVASFQFFCILACLHRCVLLGRDSLGDMSAEPELQSSCRILCSLFFLLLPFLLTSLKPVLPVVVQACGSHMCTANSRRGWFRYRCSCTSGHSGKVKTCCMGLFGPVLSTHLDRLILRAESLWPMRSSAAQIAVMVEMLIAPIKGLIVLASKVRVKC